MNDSYFYYGQIIKARTVFGALFNNVKVARLDSDGSPTKIIPVPITPFSDDIELKEFSSLGYRGKANRFYNRLPIMVYRARTPTPINTQKFPNKSGHLRAMRVEDDIAYANMTGIPVNVPMELTVYSDRESDILQVYEQLRPFFQPSYTVNIAEMGGTENLFQSQIRWTGESSTDEYDDQGRMVELTITFDMEWIILGPRDHGGRDMIKTIHINFFSDEEGFPDHSKRDNRGVITALPVEAESHSEVDKYVVKIEGNNEL